MDSLPQTAAAEATGSLFDRLTRLACRMGAGAAVVVPAAAVVVDDALAGFCLPPGCDNYGASANCPPHVAGPEGMRILLAGYRWTLVLKIELPAEILLSHQRIEVFQLLHQVAAAVESAARACGFLRARAFAGGCCKPLFCPDHPECRVLASGGACRHPDTARPSMSGFGIDVARLMEAAGWTLKRIAAATDAQEDAVGSVCAMVLVD